MEQPKLTRTGPGPHGVETHRPGIEDDRDRRWPRAGGTGIAQTGGDGGGCRSRMGPRGVVGVHDEHRPIRRPGVATSVAGRRRPHRMPIGAARLRVALEGDRVDAAESARTTVSAARFCTHVRVRCKR